MPGKRNKQVEKETEHLMEVQISELPDAILEFIANETEETAVTALQLKPEQLREYAGDFLDSEEGRKYWPLSDLNQWKYESTHMEVKKWLGDLMVRLRKKKNTRNFSTIDHDDTYTPQKGRDTITVKPSPVQKKRTSPLVSREKTSSRTPETLSSKKDPTTPSRRAKSPTLAPDVPYEEPPQTSVSSPKKSLRPTPASIRIAEEKFKSPGSDTVNNEARLGLGFSPKTPRKRPAEDEASVNLSKATVESSADRANKRMNPGPSFVEETSMPQDPVFDLDDLITESTPPPTTMMPAPDRPPNFIAALTNTQQISSPPNTITAYGLQFSAENLSKVPGQVLGYITECVNHHIHLANGTEDPKLVAEYRSRSLLFQKLHADVESRIKCLADDAEETRRVESSHCLWS